MLKKNAQQFAQKLLTHAGITINGTQPWDIQVHNDKLYQRVIAEGSLGLGESYMEGWWDCPHLDQFFFKVFRSRTDEHLGKSLADMLNGLCFKLFNYQSKSRAFQIGEHHYDLGNDLFEKMLDKRMIYSCGYWKNAKTLDEAQEAKLDLICRKLYLKPGMKVLDIGCGWGGFAFFAAEKYGVEVVGVSVSKEQIAYAEAKRGKLPVTFLLQDYRDITGSFDRVVSVGMFEHVGYKNYTDFMTVVNRCMKDDGLCLLHTIGATVTSFHPDPWIQKYIFPNGMLPSLAQIATASEDFFVIEDVHNFGADYDTTLMAWHKNFTEAWPSLKASYDETFRRMWNYYLLSCAGLFRARGIQLYQVVLSKQGLLGGYVSVR